MSFPPAHLRPLLSEAAALLRKRAETVAVVDTTCGGLISAFLLSQPGASSYFGGGVVGYNVETRIKLLGLTQQDIDQYKGPTEAIVTRLAENIRQTLGTTWAVAESGCAGPTRPTKYAPEVGGPGHCPIAVVGPDGLKRSRTIETGKTEREENMVLFAEQAVKALVEGLQEVEGGNAQGKTNL